MRMIASHAALRHLPTLCSEYTAPPGHAALTPATRNSISAPFRRVPNGGFIMTVSNTCGQSPRWRC